MEYIEPMFTSRALSSDSSRASISFVFRKLMENKLEAGLERCKLTNKVQKSHLSSKKNYLVFLSMCSCVLVVFGLNAKFGAQKALPLLQNGAVYNIGEASRGSCQAPGLSQRPGLWRR